VLAVESLSEGVSESAVSRYAAMPIRRDYVDACGAGRCLTDGPVVCGNTTCRQI